MDKVVWQVSRQAVASKSLSAKIYRAKHVAQTLTMSYCECFALFFDILLSFYRKM